VGVHYSNGEVLMASFHLAGNILCFCRDFFENSSGLSQICSQLFNNLKSPQFVIITEG